MIASFRSKALRAFFEKSDSSKFGVQKPDRIRRILLALDIAAKPEQLNIPGLRFHALKGRDKGRFSVWANENYRITFCWSDEDATEVDLEDYH